MECGRQLVGPGLPEETMERTIGMADVVDAAVSSSLPGGAAEFDTTAVAVETRGILVESPVQAVKVDDSTSGQPEGSISELREPDWPDLQAVPRPVAAEGQELMGPPSFTGNLSWGQNIEPENSEPDDDELNSKAPSPLITKVSSKREKPKATVTEFDDEDEVEAIQVTVTRHPKTTTVEPATVMITINDPPKTSRPKVQTQIAYVEDDLDDEEDLPSPKRPSKDRKKPEDDDDDERVCLTETFIQEIIGPSVTKTSVMELVVVQQTSTSTADTPKESKGKGKDGHRLQTSGNVGKESERSRCWASIIMASIGLFTVLVIGVGQWI
jgi:hypothetical protein